MRQNDKISFVDVGDQAVEIVSVTKSYTQETEGPNGFDLRNNVNFGTDVTFVVRNEATGATQEIVLLDAWSGSLNDQWMDLLADLGLDGFGVVPQVEPELPEEVDTGSDEVTIVDLIGDSLDQNELIAT